MTRMRWISSLLFLAGLLELTGCSSPKKQEICDLVENQVPCSSDEDCPCSALSCDDKICVTTVGEPGRVSEGTLREYDGPKTTSAENHCAQLRALPCDPEMKEKKANPVASNASGTEEEPGSSSGDSPSRSTPPSSTPETPSESEEESSSEEAPPSRPSGSGDSPEPSETTFEKDPDWYDNCVAQYSVDQFAMETAGCTEEYYSLRLCVMDKLLCPEGMALESALEETEKKCGEQKSDLNLCLTDSHCNRSGFYCEEFEFSDVCYPRAQSGCVLSEAECEPKYDPLGDRWRCTCTQGLNRGFVFTTYDDGCCDNAHILEEMCGYGIYYEKPKPTIENVLGQPCKTDEDCGDAICQVSNFSARPFCTVRCDLRNEICHLPGEAGGEGTYYEGFWCMEMQGGFEGRINTFCAPGCQELGDCDKFDTGFDTCAPPQYHGIPPVSYVADSYNVCSAPPADPGPPVDPVLCDYEDKVAGPAIVIDVCQSYCEFVSTCKMLPDGVSPDCCEWGCYLWATPTGTTDTDRKADLICYTNAYKGNLNNSTVCTAPIDTCGEPPVLEP